MRALLSNQLFSNTASQLVVKVLSSGTTFLVTILISYFLGLPVYGSFIKVTTFVSIFYLIIDFGINSIFIRDFYEQTHKKFVNLVFLRLCIALLVFLTLTVITFLLPYNSLTQTGFSSAEKIGVILFSLTLFTQGFLVSLQSIFQKNEQYSLGVIPSVTSSIVLITGILFSIALKNFYLILFSFILSAIVACYFGFVRTNKLFNLYARSHDLSIFSKQILKSSLPLALMLFLNVVYFRADSFILSLQKSNLDVGVYGLAYKFFEFCIALPTFFSNSVYPQLIRLQDNEEQFEKKIFKYSKLLLLLSVLLIGIIFIFSQILPFIRSGFGLSVFPLRILSLSLPFFFLTSLLQWVLVIRKETKTLLGIYGLTMVINISLNMIFVPRYSYIASSFITVITEGLVFISFLIILLLLKPVKNTRIQS